MTTNSPLMYEFDEGIARITFNRPDMLNAINPELAAAFEEVCRAIAADPAVRVVVVSGMGKGFMAGGDIGQFVIAPKSVPTMLIDPMHRAMSILCAMDAPVIASVHGAVAGAGMSIALAADIVLAAEGARFAFAYTHLATSCDLGMSWSLPRLVGMKRALEIALLPDVMSAVAARDLGLVNRVVVAERLADETEALARQFASGPTVAYGCLKRLMRLSLSNTLEEQLSAERGGFSRCVETDDFREGVSAFLEKRKPDFAGK